MDNLNVLSGQIYKHWSGLTHSDYFSTSSFHFHFSAVKKDIITDKPRGDSNQLTYSTSCAMLSNDSQVTGEHDNRIRAQKKFYVIAVVVDRLQIGKNRFRKLCLFNLGWRKKTWQKTRLWECRKRQKMIEMEKGVKENYGEN